MNNHKPYKSMFFRIKTGLIISFVTCFGFGQNVEHWSENESLAARNVNHGIQDKKGFIWFATDNGLSRFDGYSFEYFRVKNLKGLISDKINFLHQSENELLWIATSNGISVLDLKTYKIKRNYFPFKNSAGNSTEVFCIVEDDNKTIWVSSADGQVQKKEFNKNFELVENTITSDKKFGIRPHLTYCNGIVFIMSENRGIFYITKKNKCFQFASEKKLLKHNGNIQNIRGEGIVASTKSGFVKVNLKTQSLTPVLKQFGPETFLVHKDNSNNVWAIQNDRKTLQKYDFRNKLLKDYTSFLFDPKDNVHLNFLFEDRSSNIWLCTNSGVYKTTNEQSKFQTLLTTDQFQAPNYIPSFRGMLEDKEGTLFIGGYSGLFRIDKNGSMRRLFDNKIPYTPYKLFEKNKDELWAACEGYGIISVNKRTGEIHQFDQQTKVIYSYKGIYLKAAVIAKDGDFWLASYDGILRFNTKTNKYYLQDLIFGKLNVSSKCQTSDIKQHLDGSLWVCTDKGVFVFNEKGNPLKHYHNKGKGTNYIPFNDLNCVLFDAKGQTWFASKSKGIAIRKGNKLEYLNINNGLCDNGVASLTQDLNQHVWIATNKGLSSYSLKNKKIKNYYLEDGLSNNEFNHSSNLVTRKGNLFFGGINGINSFLPGTEKKQIRKQGKLIISKVEIPLENNLKLTEYNDQKLQKRLHLSPDLSHLYLEFFVDNFLRSEKNTYEYFLKGYDKNWQYLGTQNHIRFTGLAPGKYVLFVRATDSKGTKISNKIRVELTVDQVFYKTWWFILILLTGLSSILTYVMYQRNKRYQLIYQLRNEIASDIHDNFGSTLTKIAMESELLEEEATPVQKVLFNEISTNCRSAVSGMRDLVWCIDDRNETVINLFDKMNELAYNLFKKTHIDYQIKHDFAERNPKLNPIQRKELFFIYKEALTNMLRHGDHGKVDIQLKLTEKTLSLRIFNTTNTKEQKISTGMGLSNMKNRVRKLDGEITFKTEDGFEIFIHIPLNQNIFSKR